VAVVQVRRAFRSSHVDVRYQNPRGVTSCRCPIDTAVKRGGVVDVIFCHIAAIRRRGGALGEANGGGASVRVGRDTVQLSLQLFHTLQQAAFPTLRKTRNNPATLSPRESPNLSAQALGTSLLTMTGQMHVIANHNNEIPTQPNPISGIETVQYVAMFVHEYRGWHAVRWHVEEWSEFRCISVCECAQHRRNLVNKQRFGSSPYGSCQGKRECETEWVHVAIVYLKISLQLSVLFPGCIQLCP
jgi:hypothetical protein